jgi:hypothetical protein
LDKSQKNDPYSYYDGVNKFNRFDKHEVFVKACNPDNCSLTENIAISVIEINDPPRIEEKVIGYKKPIFDRDFHVQFEITDPDYDFNNIPPSYYGSYKLTFDSWLACSQKGNKIGYMMIDCKGIPKEKEDNKFTIYIKFSDGISTAEESFKYEAIDYADYLNL